MKLRKVIYMKKVLSIIVTIALIFTIVTPNNVFARTSAEQKIKLTEAIESAKKILNITTENYNFNYNYNENRDGRSAWELNWNSKNNLGGSVNVSVDSESGDIINFNSWEPNDGRSVTRIPKYSKENAYNEVVKFIEKLQPARSKEMVLKESPVSQYDMPMYSDTYSFNFVRVVNDIDFSDNGITVNIDKNTLKIRNYNFNWDNGPFTDKAKAIELQEAKKTFENKLGIELSYNIIYNQKDKTQNAVLVYSLKNGNSPIDAVTGEVLNNGWSQQYGGAFDKVAATSNMKASLTPEEQKSVDASSNYVSKEKAIEEAQKYIILDAGLKPSYSSLYANSYDNSATWNFSWDINDAVKKTYNYMSASVDANSGKIKSFSMGGNTFYPEKETPVSYTTEQAIQIAEKFINTLEPDKFKMTKNKDMVNQYYMASSPVTNYNFNYVANINGANCSFDSFNISVNAYTGKVMNYSMNWKDIKLPPVDLAMKLDDAYKTFYTKAKLTLKYIKFYNYNQTGNMLPQIKLVYVLDDFSGMFDANTGAFLYYNGDPVKDKKNVSFTDIKGISAENDINILVDMGIIDIQGDKFDPDAIVLQKDFIKMLVKSLGPNYAIYSTAENGSKEDYDNYYAAAIQKNIITEKQKNPDSHITKQEGAKLIVRTMGMGYIGEIDNIYNLKFKDADQLPNGYKGYVALAAGLNIIKPVSENFEGNKEIARSEVASFIVNYLKVDTNK